LKELELKVKQQQLAENYLTSTADLVDNSEIHNFFTDLLNTYSEKFATIKSINLSQLPLHFESFHFDPKTGKGYGEMGKCWVENIIYLVNQKEVNISLNRLYLLNRLGIDRYFTSDDYSYIDISFDKMIDTCCHELAHYLQYVKHGKSSCESDLVLGSGSEALESFPKRREKYDEELAREHEK
jgi:hypothetical protein